MKLALVHLSETAGHPPLSLGYIASYLRKYYNFNNTVIVDKEDPIKKIEKLKPDVVGITAVTIQHKKASLLALKIKERFDIPVMIGGPHITNVPHLLPESFDVGVLGEGEQTTLELVQHFENFGGFDISKLKEIKGIAFHDDNKVIINERRPLIKDLDTIPFPARDLMKMNEYYLKPRRIFRGYVTIGTHIMTSRGCPYRCVFCSTSQFWQKTRFHSAEYVVREMEEVIDKYKVKAICIFDDLFIADKKRVKKISQLVRERGINDKVVFACQCRANLIDEDVCKTLKDMGMINVSFGMESGSEKTLGYLKKNTVTVSQNKNAVKLCKKFGFSVHGDFMIGSPFETESDLEQTLNFIKESPFDSVAVYITTPFPGTELWEYSKKEGFVSDDMDFEKLDIDLSDENFEEKILLDKEIDKEYFFKKVVPKFQRVIDEKYYSDIKLNIKSIDVLSPNLWKRVLGSPNQSLRYLRNILRSRIHTSKQS